MVSFIRSLLGFGHGAPEEPGRDSPKVPSAEENAAAPEPCSELRSRDEGDDASLDSALVQEALADLRGAHSDKTTSSGRSQAEESVSTVSSKETMSTNANGMLSELQMVVIKALQDFVHRPDLPIVMTLSPDLLKPLERKKLGQIGYHFRNKKHPRDEPEGSEDGPADNKKNKQDIGSYQMKKFIEKKRLFLDQVFVDHVRANGTGGQAFLENEVTLHFHAQSLTSDQMCEVFAACYHFALDLKERSRMDHVRWLFTLIMFAEMMAIVNPREKGLEAENRPAVRIQRVGDQMNRRAIRFLQAAFQDDVRTQTQAIENLKVWCGMGDKLKVLCERFGEGCLFFLEKDLSRDYIINKFPLSGRQADRGFSNLERLDLKQRAEATKMTELGRNIRHFMIAPMVERLAQGDF